MAAETSPIPPASQGWVDFVQNRQALAAANPALKAHFDQEIAVARPTLTVLGVNPDQGAPPVPADQTHSANKTPPTNASVKAVDTTSALHPQPGSLASQGQGHISGQLIATDPNKYDKLIREACDHYGELYGVTLDPNMVKAHIWQEAKGDRLAMGSDGQNSRGLMQVANSADRPTASVLAAIRNPDGSVDRNIPKGGGDQFDARTSIFTGVKYDALAMSGKMGDMLELSGMSRTELGTFPDRRLSQRDAMRAYQGGPGVLTQPTGASEIYAQQLTGLTAQFAANKAPSDPGYTNPGGGPGWREPRYGQIV